MGLFNGVEKNSPATCNIERLFELLKKDIERSLKELVDTKNHESKAGGNQTPFNKGSVVYEKGCLLVRYHRGNRVVYQLKLVPSCSIKGIGISPLKGKASGAEMAEFVLPIVNEVRLQNRNDLQITVKDSSD